MNRQRLPVETAVSSVMRMVCITQTIVPILETIIFSKEKVFRIAGAIFLVPRKIFSKFAAIFCIPHTKDSKTKTKVEATQKCFCVAPKHFCVLPTIFYADS